MSERPPMKNDHILIIWEIDGQYFHYSYAHGERVRIWHDSELEAIQDIEERWTGRYVVFSVDQSNGELPTKRQMMQRDAEATAA